LRVGRNSRKILSAEPQSDTETTAPVHRSRASAEQPTTARGFTHDWAPAALYLLFDVLTWLTIYSIASFLRHELYSERTPLEFFFVEVLQLVVVVQALLIIGGYDRHTEMRSLSYTAEHILAVIGAAIVSSFIVYAAATFDQSMKPSRGVVLFSFIVFVPVSLAYRRWIRRFVAEVSATKTFLVIGSGEVAARFKRAYEEAANPQTLEFVSIEKDRAASSAVGEWQNGAIDFAAKIDNLDKRYSGIILAEPSARLQPELIDRLVRTQFQRTRVYTLESFYETHWRYVPLNVIDPIWPLQSGFQLARTSPYHYLKRVFDLALSTVALIVFAPVIALVALLIWLESGRPVIFSQERVGRDQRSFIMYKFRTMKSAASDDEDEIYTRKGDPRLLRIGGWVRKLRLDELPQLWNVFRGEMSLIGPRPEWTRCSELYEKKIPFYHFRHLVKPGITGWAQVNYPYGASEADAMEKLKYDLYYIRHYSLKLDAMITLKTVHTMLFGRGR
jgi:exopolysaccharide biosynthesis polyprenyl glycosylphosphotransferase